MKEEIKDKYSFWRGWEQLPIKDMQAAREELSAAMGIDVTSRQAFINRRNGQVLPKLDQYLRINNVFAKYGITDVWGGKSHE